MTASQAPPAGRGSPTRFLDPCSEAMAVAVRSRSSGAGRSGRYPPAGDAAVHEVDEALQPLAGRVGVLEQGAVHDRPDQGEDRLLRVDAGAPLPAGAGALGDPGD